VKTLQERIIVLWTVFLLGTLFHTQLGLMPLFHGINVAVHNEQPATTLNEIASILWAMLTFFAVPMFVIIATAFINSKRYKIFHFGLTIVYSVLNFLHVVLDLMIQPIVWSQIALMVILFVIGLLLNLVAWQWMKEHFRGRRLQAEIATSES
jgi:hypothetical protein